MIKSGQINYMPNTTATRINPHITQLVPTDSQGNPNPAHRHRRARRFCVAVNRVPHGYLAIGQAGVELIGENRGPKYEPRHHADQRQGALRRRTAAAGDTEKIPTVYRELPPARREDRQIDHRQNAAEQPRQRRDQDVSTPES